MGLRTHEKRPLFLLRDLAKSVNTAASYHEMSLAVKPDLSLRSTFPFRVARAKQTARKGTSDVPFVRDFQRYTQMERFLAGYPDLTSQMWYIERRDFTYTLIAWLCNFTIGRNIQSAGCMGPVQGDTRNDCVLRTWWRDSDLKNVQILLQESSYRTGFANSPFKKREGNCNDSSYSQSLPVLLLPWWWFAVHVFLSLGHIVAYNKVVLNSTSKGRSLLNTTQK